MGKPIFCSLLVERYDNYSCKFFFYDLKKLDQFIFLYLDDTSITAASDKNVFYYQYHPCGNIPHPTNTRFDIDGLSDNNDYNNPSAKGKYFHFSI